MDNVGCQSRSLWCWDMAHVIHLWANQYQIISCACYLLCTKQSIWSILLNYSNNSFILCFVTTFCSTLKGTLKFSSPQFFLSWYFAIISLSFFFYLLKVPPNLEESIVFPYSPSSVAQTNAKRSWVEVLHQIGNFLVIARLLVQTTVLFEDYLNQLSKLLAGNSILCLLHS